MTLEQLEKHQELVDRCDLQARAAHRVGKRARPGRRRRAACWRHRSVRQTHGRISSQPARSLRSELHGAGSDGRSRLPAKGRVRRAHDRRRIRRRHHQSWWTPAMPANSRKKSPRPISTKPACCRKSIFASRPKAPARCVLPPTCKASGRNGTRHDVARNWRNAAPPLESASARMGSGLAASHPAPLAGTGRQRLQRLRRLRTIPAVICAREMSARAAREIPHTPARLFSRTTMPRCCPMPRRRRNRSRRTCSSRGPNAAFAVSCAFLRATISRSRA